MRIPSTLLCAFWLLSGVHAASPGFPVEFPERAAAEILRSYRGYGTEVEFTLSLSAPRLVSIKKGAAFEKDQLGKTYWAARFRTEARGTFASDSTGSYGVVLSDGERYFTMSESDLEWLPEEKIRNSFRSEVRH